jgi:adenylate cyclase
MRDEDLAILQAAGLYDPAAPNATERLELIDWLSSQGATLEQMVDATRSGALTSLAGDLLLQSERCFSLEEAALRSGMSVERLETIGRAVGLPYALLVLRFSAADVATFAAFDQAVQLFGEEAVLHFMRVVGSSLARVAEAAVSLFLVNIEGPIHECGGSELALAQANQEVIRTFGILSPVMNSLVRAHLEVATRRMRTARHEHSVDLVQMAVGFVDLVGFTALSRQLSARELADLVEQFEALANDLVVAHDGRLVKLIGDAVMFVARDSASACDVALALIERFADKPAITPHAGLAAGPLLMRGGDYYGPVVNLASRVADLAVPCEVLVTAEVVERSKDDRLRFQPAGKRMLKGFDEPVPLYSAERRQR